MLPSGAIKMSEQRRLVAREDDDVDITLSLCCRDTNVKPRYDGAFMMIIMIIADGASAMSVARMSAVIQNLRHTSHAIIDVTPRCCYAFTLLCDTTVVGVIARVVYRCFALCRWSHCCC